ncbi:hypothetical protein ACMYR2_0438 [Nitrobacter sp. TKz-YC01]
MPGPFLLLLPFRSCIRADRTVTIMSRPSMPKTHLPPRDEATRRAIQTVCMALTVAVIAVAARIIAVWP